MACIFCYCDLSQKEIAWIFRYWWIVVVAPSQPQMLGTPFRLSPWLLTVALGFRSLSTLMEGPVQGSARQDANHSTRNHGARDRPGRDPSAMQARPSTVVWPNQHTYLDSGMSFSIRNATLQSELAIPTPAPSLATATTLFNAMQNGWNMRHDEVPSTTESPLQTVAMRKGLKLRADAVPTPWLRCLDRDSCRQVLPEGLGSGVYCPLAGQVRPQPALHCLLRTDNHFQTDGYWKAIADGGCPVLSCHVPTEPNSERNFQPTITRQILLMSPVFARLQLFFALLWTRLFFSAKLRHPPALNLIGV
ncbi:hypothetical protein J3F84DRAFT_308248 [Trichoderma pleuroticola]